MQDLPLLGVTMGDPSGSGSEIVVKAWADPAVRSRARMIVIGDAGWMEQALALVGVPGKVHAISDVRQARYAPDELDVLQATAVDLSGVEYGRVQAAAGQVAYDTVIAGIDLAMERRIDALVTSAINKEALNLAGHHYDGHTGLLAYRTGTPKVTMMLKAGNFCVSHVSTHCSLREAIDRVKADRIVDVIRLTQRGLQQMGVERPRVAVAGLNPHSGEGGLFGDEEVREIGPAIERARAEGMEVYPVPVPPDTVFYLMAEQQRFDAVVAMYHDQGHIPTKLIGFAEGVNITLGLPIIRTSVDHGTNFGKAGKGTAYATSMICAIDAAVALVTGKSA
ncbi:MAG: 4-hydroxythreonine-4-phosphate dehydrogenase PdxA [Anaerolineae bacterium]|jgi:4-hydroxythreonine-4-phosphate dehydrogenase